jgi:hypothetical protein
MMTLYVNHTTLNCRQVGYLAASTNEATWKLLILSMTLLHEDKLHTSGRNSAARQKKGQLEGNAVTGNI